MPPLLHVSTVFVACLAAVALAPPAVAAPMDPTAGTVSFASGSTCPGLYHTGGSGSVFGVWINDVPTQESMCSWFTYSTPDAAKDRVVQTNTSIGPMYANINETVMALEPRTVNLGRGSPRPRAG